MSKLGHVTGQLTIQRRLLRALAPSLTCQQVSSHASLSDAHVSNLSGSLQAEELWRNPAQARARGLPPA